MDFLDDVLTIDITRAYPQNRITKAVRTFSFAENGVTLKDMFRYDGRDHASPVRERFVTLIKPQVTENIITLDEVSLRFDKMLWRVEVSEAVHREHADKGTKVYFIDFVNETFKPEFQLEIRCSEKGEG